MTNKSMVRQSLAAAFLAALEQEQLPWEAGWTVPRPQNPVSGKPYRGINRLWLSYIAQKRGWMDPRWCTYRQAQEQGWQVRKGEKSSKVEFWSVYDIKQHKSIDFREAEKLVQKDPEYQKNLRMNVKVYSVFNCSQVDGVPEWRRSRTDIGALRDQRDTLLRNMAVKFREEGLEAYYSPITDTVVLPPEGLFRDSYAYMATLLHECGHASGHERRLGRDMTGRFGSESYAREELRAEIASAFTAQELGFPGMDETHRQSHIAYVQNWITVLQNEPKELFRAVKAAEEISDYLLEKGDFLTAPEHQPAALEPLQTSTGVLPRSSIREAIQRIRQAQQTPDTPSRTSIQPEL